MHNVILVTMVTCVMQDELDSLIKAAEEGNVSSLKYLIEEKKIDIETRAPRNPPYVS